MCRDVVRRRRRRAHAPVIHAASHFYHDKRVAWVYISFRVVLTYCKGVIVARYRRKLILALPLLKGDLPHLH